MMRLRGGTVYQARDSMLHVLYNEAARHEELARKTTAQRAKESAACANALRVTATILRNCTFVNSEGRMIESDTN